MQHLSLGYLRSSVVIHQHHVLFSDSKVVGMLSEEVSELFDMLSANVTHLRRCLRPMTKQWLDWHFRSSSILKQLLREIIFRFLNVILLNAARSTLLTRLCLVAVDVDVITVDEKQCGILKQELLQAYKNNAKSFWLVVQTNFNDRRYANEFEGRCGSDVSANC